MEELKRKLYPRADEVKTKERRDTFGIKESYQKTLGFLLCLLEMTVIKSSCIVKFGSLSEGFDVKFTIKMLRKPLPTRRELLLSMKSEQCT